MKIIAQENIDNIYKIIINYYDDYNIIHRSTVNNDVYFIVVEKFFFRNSSRASLSIVLARSHDEHQTIIEAVGSGGGQGMIFKFDWGAKESFESAIPSLLSKHRIVYHTK